MNRNATLNILRKQASHLIDAIKSEKKYKGICWEKAVPGTPEGQEAFKDYCFSKMLLKRYRADLNTTNTLIRHIKKNIK